MALIDAPLIYWMRICCFLTNCLDVSPPKMLAFGCLAETVCILSIALSFGHSYFRTAACAHVAFSSVKATVLVAAAFQPEWFDVFRVLIVALLLTASAWTLCMFTLYSMLDMELDIVPFIKVSLLVFDAFCNAIFASTVVADRLSMLCQPLLSRRMPLQEGSSLDETVPRCVQTLSDITLRTFRLEEIDTTGGGLSARDTCCVCMSPMAQGEVVTELACTHRYHASCMKDWATHQTLHRRSVLCPLRCDLRDVSCRESNLVISEEPGTVVV
eukprot:TRINITY_DN18537_c0_g3_i1.p1 TRINITY_DN18537_c0_g3~~TRINITY_DN18537_c0_g3_i1.p1  ORF type:complete len:271 (+),score=35.49 TRINITY_DN18537_c0_g3_i1:37-849(+)